MPPTLAQCWGVLGNCRLSRGRKCGRHGGSEESREGWEGVGAERICLHKIFGTASKMQASWERGLRGSQTTVKLSPGEVQDRAGVSPLRQGWSSALPNSPLFYRKPVHRYKSVWAGNPCPDFNSAITKWTSQGLSCPLVKIGKAYPGFLPGKEHAKKQTVLTGSCSC